MKRSLYVTGLVLIATLSFGCDYIDAPYVVQGPNGCTVPQPTFTPRDDADKHRKVLVEEFTGHRCGNCPRGAETIANLEAANPDQIVAIAHHTFNLPQFTEPLENDTTTNPFLHYLYDFRSQESYDIDTKFGISTAGVPTGFVDRKDYGSGVILAYTSWTARVATQLSIPQQMDIQLAPYWTPSDSSVCVYYFVEAMANLTSTYKIAIYITESNIIQWQKDYNVTPNDIEFYTHKHVMRKAVNTVNGTLLTSNTTIADGDTFLDGFSTKIDPGKWDVDNLHIVAFVYDDVTDQVIQAEEIKLTP